MLVNSNKFSDDVNGNNKGYLVSVWYDENKNYIVGSE